MTRTICRTRVEATERAIRKAASKTLNQGGATWVETAGQPSRTFVVVPQGTTIKLGGYRSIQPKRLAPRHGVEVYRIPLPRKGTVTGGMQQEVTINGTSERNIDWKARGIDIEDAGDAETWSAQRINELETVEGVGGEVWSALAATYERESEGEYDPKTSVLMDQAESMPRVLGRIVREPKRQLGREHRVVPVGQATEIGSESFAWLMRQPGRTAEEKAHRGVLCSVRTTDYDALENRVVRDYAQRTIREVQRTPHAKPLLKQWERECHWVDRGLRELGVGMPRGRTQANQVLRMNPDYRRVWEARKALLDRLEQTELLWCWQGETWNEFALCLFKAAVARHLEADDPQAGWHAAIRSPIRMRRGQHQGRWIETDQQTAGIWVHMSRKRVLRLLGGGMQSEGSPWTAACRALLYEMDGKNQKIGEMNVYAMPPADCVARDDWHEATEACGDPSVGSILVVTKSTSKEARTSEFVHPGAGLGQAMKTIGREIESFMR